MTLTRIRPAPITHGNSLHRLNSSPEEKLFAQAWADRQRDDDLLAYLMGNGRSKTENLSEADHKVAATVVQWFGSPVGQNFLRDLGYEKERVVIKEAKPSKKVVKLKRFVGQLRGLLIRVHGILSELEKLDDL
jgi:hypothetical protein